MGREGGRPGLGGAAVLGLLSALLLLSACTRPARTIPDVPPRSGPEGVRRARYTIQVGAFADPANAARLSETLRARGLDALHFREGGGLYRVRFGDFPTRAAALRRAEELRAAGTIEVFYLVAPEEQPLVRSGSEAALRRQLVETAQGYLGVPYLWGGSSAAGFDCSGLARTVYAVNGLLLPRASREQFAAGREVVSEGLQPGDLVFFSARVEGPVSHVGIFVGEGRFIHAPREGNPIRAERLDMPYFADRFRGGRSYL